MATIAQLPFSPFHYRKPLLYSHHQQSRIFVSYLNLTKKKKNCFVCFACSIKQIRVRKRVKSNEELRSEIMEFVALNGFPQGHVPSMKELSAHGRVDLANVVRRRGYKFIRELLANSEIEDCCNELVSEENTKIEASASDISLEDSLTEGQGEEAALDVVERNLSSERPSSTEIDLSAVDDSMPLDPKINNISEEGVIVNSSPEAEEYGSVSNEESSLAGVSSMGSSLANFGDSNYSGEVRENTLKVEILELSNRADIENSFSEKFTSTELSLTAIDGSMPLDQKINCFPEEGGFETSSPEAEECGSVSRDESSLAGVSSMGNSLANLEDSNYSGEITENNLKIESVEFNNRADIECSSSEASVSAYQSLLLDDTSSYSDREADNVLMTEDVKVNAVEEDLSLNRDHYTSPDLNYTNHFDIDTESISTENFQNLQIDDMSENRFGKNSMLEPSSSTSSIEEKTTRFIQNGYLDTVDVSDNENDIPNESSAEETKESAEASKGGNSYGGQRSLSTPPNGSALALEEITDATEVNSSDRNIDQRDGRGDLDKDPHDETMKRENQVEITRLRFMLLQKEQELSRLKEQIEKEKLSLSVLQRQAETEIQKAQMLVSEKDVELQEAEESLSGLQEVEIEYCGDGNVVEVTGSFNGWEHRVGLELQASKSIGKQKCWSTLLWLYPGTYEIKFIVDGQWTTDPRQESVTRGHITNNILKVKS